MPAFICNEIFTIFCLVDNITVNCMKLWELNWNNPTALNSKAINWQLGSLTYMSITKPNSANACLVLSYAIVYKWG